MANFELKRHKKSDKIKWVLTGIAFVLLFVFLAGLCMQLFAKDDKYKPSEWFKKQDTEQTEQLPAEGGENGTARTRIKAMAAKFSLNEETDGTGIMPLSNSEIMPLYNPNMSASELCTITGSSTASFLSDSELALWQSILTVNNNITNETLNNFIFYYDIGIIPSVRLLFEKKSVFEDLSDFTLKGVASYVNGKDIAHTRVQSDYTDYWYVMFAGGRTPSACKTNSVVLTYRYEDNRVPVPLPDDPVKEGYTFVGWYYDAAFETPYAGEPIYADTNLYAKFEINHYTVTFNSYGGTAVESQTVDWNTSATLTTPTRVGYTFKGWFLPDGTQYTNQAIKENTTLTARWEVVMCTVTFYVGGEIYETKTVEYGTPLVSVVESASEMNLCVMSVRSALGSMDGETLTKAVVTDDSLELLSEELTGTDKVVNTVKNNKWQILGGVAGGVALIAVVAAIVGGTKRKRR